MLPKHVEENVMNDFINFKWALQNAVLAHSPSFTSSWRPLCESFQFTLKTAVHSFILSHLLKPVFCFAAQLVAVCQHLLCFSDSFLLRLHRPQSSLLCIFILITIPVLLSVSQSICQTLLNQHKSIPAPSILAASGYFSYFLLTFFLLSRLACMPSWPCISLLIPPSSVTASITCELHFGAYFYYFKAC